MISLKKFTEKLQRPAITGILSLLALSAGQNAEASVITDKVRNNRLPENLEQLANPEGINTVATGAMIENLIPVIPGMGVLRNIAPASAANPVELSGWISHNSLWNKNLSTNYGIYSFPAKAGTSFSKTLTTRNASAAALANDMYCGYYVLDYGGTVVVRYYAYDLTTGAVYEKPYNTSNTPNMYTVYANAMAYDHTTRTLYGEFISADGKYATLAAVDQLTGKPATAVNLSDELLFLALAFDSRGTLYGISSEGDLYRFSSDFATHQLVGATGLHPKYAQSATIDPATDTMYWAYLSGDFQCGLYSVDLNTGKASKISDFPGTTEIVGLATQFTPQGAAPAEITSATFTPASNGAKNGTMTITLPATTAAGSPLSGNIDLTVNLDGAPLAGAPTNAAAGSTVEFAISGEEGAHRLNIFTACNNLQGTPLNKSIFLGADIPGAVESLNFTLQGRTATVSWSAPTTGGNGGWFDPSGLTYTVVRQPDNTTVATRTAQTTITDEIPDRLGNYFYTVTPQTTLTGISTPSNVISYGTTMAAPYRETFDTDAPLDLFTFEDGNGDGYYWKWSNGALVNGRGEAEDAYDWIITPPITLTNDYIYKLSFDAHAYGTYYTEEIIAGFGSQPKASAMKQTGYYSVQGETPVKFESLVEIPADGIYYIGIAHATKTLTRDDLTIDNIELIPFIPCDAPAEMSNLRIELADADPLQATILFDAPTTAINGKPLRAISKIEIYRNGELLQTISEAAPGQHFQFPVSLLQGEQQFNIIAHNELGRGHDSFASVFGGVDIPAAVRNVTFEWDPADDNKATLSWEAPELIGIHGRPIAANALSYTVLTPMFGSWMPSANNLKTTTYTVSGTYTQPTLKQLAVQAVTAGGKSDPVAVLIPMGPAYQLPAYDTFSGGATNYPTWTIATTSGNLLWGMANDGTIGTSQDNDNGFAVAMNQGDASASGRLITPAFTFNANNEPQYLHFWVYTSAEASRQTAIQIEATTTGSHFTPISPRYPVYNTQEGWREIVLPLETLKGARKASLAFHAYVDAEGAPIKIDNISIENNPAGIDGIIADETFVLISSDRGAITISGAEGLPYRITDLSGRTVTAGSLGSSAATVDLPVGIYIATAGCHTEKVTVK